MADLATRQHGVFAVWQGVGRDAVKRRLRRGGLFRIHRGVYSLSPPHTLRVEGHWMAAVLACGPGAALSHGAAAALWDLRRPSGTVVDVTVPSTAGRARHRGIRLHRSRTLTAEQRTTHRGIPVTSVARTLIDIADTHDRRTAERTTDQAEVLRRFDLRGIEAAIGANPGRRGAGIMRRLLADYAIGENVTESELEDEFLRFCDRFDIPRPSAQVRTGAGRVDFEWRTERLVVEVDGWRWHGGRNAWEEDHKRTIRLQRDGHRVARVSYGRMKKEPAVAADDLKALLSAAPSAARRPVG